MQVKTHVQKLPDGERVFPEVNEWFEEISGIRRADADGGERQE